ncbi:MAG: tRNA (adenosine(37)-N6)-dimethylallyltransferase MiaA [Fusobacterium sp.]|nr:tRNA (adenosine(37)-N6)-dimethylallyltransferase MiaA [Fusobacterium sp.]
MRKSKQVIAVVGATASGKTAYAIELAKKLGGEVISADSRLVYKGFDIGTAKPTVEERAGIPHHLIDVVEPEVDYSVGLWAKEAERLIDEIHSRGNIPIIAGGTGLYFRILLENYDLPKVEPNYELREELGALDFDVLRERLCKIDPETAEKIERNDKKKIIRALEIVETLNVPMSEARGVKEFSQYEVEWHGRNFPREELYERINKRVDLMIEMGLIEETKALLAKHGRIPNLVDTIGYREIIDYLDGKLDLKAACDILKQNTRRYAKRQLTWFRKNSYIDWNIYPEIQK